MSSYVSVPGLSGLKDAMNAFKQSIDPIDVLVGVGVGLVAGAVGDALITKKLIVPDEKTGKVMVDPAGGFGKFLQGYGNALSSVLVGGALFMVQGGNKRGAGHLVGATGAAVMPLVISKVAAPLAGSLFKGYEGYVMAPYGIIADDRRYGVIVNDPTYGNYQMAALTSVSQAMGEEADEYTV